MYLEIPLGSRDELYVPDLHPFDELSGESVDPAAAQLQVIFAMVPEDAGPPADDTGYVDGRWAAGLPSPVAAIVIGVGGAIVPATRGAYDVYCGVNGARLRPRRKVATVRIT